MAKINRYNGNVQAFGSAATGVERTVFGDELTQSNTLDANITADYLRGWGILAPGAKPPKQFFNGLEFTLSQLISYLHQMGVAEWNASQEYFDGSVATTAAGLYRLKSGGDGSVNPDTDGGTNWEKAPVAGQTVYGATNYAELETLTGGGHISQVHVEYRSTKGDGGGGLFYWDSSDLSAEVTIDTQSGIYVAPTSDLTGASGAWVRQYEGAVNVKWFGARGDGVTDDTAAIQAAISLLDSYQTLSIGEGTYKITGSGLIISNKTGVTVKGCGKLLLLGADEIAIMLQLEGTCSDITIEGLTFVGEALAGVTPRQHGIYNYSGQTIANTTVRCCKFYNLQTAISFNADLGGTYAGVTCVNNYIDTMVGQEGGQGYGIFTANAIGVLIQGNHIVNCFRHSIYAARNEASALPEHGVLIADNIIRDHRASAPTLDVRTAIYARGFGVVISRNQIINYFDGAIGVQAGTDVLAQSGNMQIVDNNLSGRGNIVQSINIGERATPTVYLMSNINVSRNTIRSDMSVCGNGTEIIINNGIDMLVSHNRIHMENILDVYWRPISVGAHSPQGATDLDNVRIISNEINGTLDPENPGVKPISVIYVHTGVATIPAGGASRLWIDNNYSDPEITAVIATYQVARTNDKIVLRTLDGRVTGVYIDGTTVPSAYGGVTDLYINNTAATDIATISGYSTNQQLTLLFPNAYTTIKHATGNIRLVGGVDFVSSSRTTLVLIYSSVYGAWLEVSRAVVV